jgi:hypothetical protein
VGHLQLGLEVADGAQAAHQEARALASGELDGQPVEGFHVDVLTELGHA